MHAAWQADSLPVALGFKASLALSCFVSFCMSLPSKNCHHKLRRGTRRVLRIKEEEEEKEEGLNWCIACTGVIINDSEQSMYVRMMYHSKVIGFRMVSGNGYERRRIKGGYLFK